MSRKFRVTIGGITYNVEVEEQGVSGAPVHNPAPAVATAQAPVRSSAPAPVHASAAAAPAPAAPVRSAAPSAEGDAVRAPLPGMVAGVKVEVGQKVNPGDVLLVLEAMKMENDITAPCAGVIKEVLVQKGTPVSLNDVLVVIG